MAERSCSWCARTEGHRPNCPRPDERYTAVDLAEERESAYSHGYGDGLAAARAEAVRDDEPVGLRAARNKVNALWHGATHEYAQGYNNGVRAAVRVLDGVLAALPRDDEPVGGLVDRLATALEAEWPWHWRDDHEGTKRGPREAAEAVIRRLTTSEPEEPLTSSEDQDR